MLNHQLQKWACPKHCPKTLPFIIIFPTIANECGFVGSELLCVPILTPKMLADESLFEALQKDWGS